MLEQRNSGKPFDGNQKSGLRTISAEFKADTKIKMGHMRMFKFFVIHAKIIIC